MKYILLLAMVGSETYAKQHRHHRLVHSLIQSSVEGIDKKDLQPDRHWHFPWPQGIDDGTDDDKIMLPGKKPKEPEKPLVYKNFGSREWTPGTWPIHHTYDKDWKWATYSNQIDDGTDDSDVLDVQQKAETLY